MRTFRAATILLLVTGCGSSPADEEMPPPPEVPNVPVLMPGQAMLAGTVTDMAGSAVAAAKVHVAETGQDAVTDAAGRFALAVIGDSTLTLQVKADGFATTHVESFAIATGRAPMLDLLLATPAKVEEWNRMGGVTADGTGVVAVMVKSVSGSCGMGGASVKSTPDGVGKVLYARADAGLAGEPDPGLTAVQAQTGVAAWLAGASPFSSSVQVQAEKAGCASAPFPVTFGDRVHSGRFRVQAGALTLVTTFLQ